MNVTVRLFAGHRERAGSDRLEVELPSGATTHELFAVLATRYPTIGETESFTSFALNREMVGSAEILHDGDEVALLQPVSGG